MLLNSFINFASFLFRDQRHFDLLARAALSEVDGKLLQTAGSVETNIDTRLIIVSG